MNAANFRWFFCSLLSLLTATIPEMVNAQVIYGLDKARQFDQSHNGPFFVQAGSFHSKYFAHELQKKLSLITDYEIHINHVGAFYSVVIGPVPTIEAVRAIGGVRTAAVAERASQVKQQVIIQKNHGQPPVTIKKNWLVASNVGFLKNNTNNLSVVANGSGFPPPLDVDQFDQQQNGTVMWDVQLGRRWSRNTEWFPAVSLALRYQHLFTSNVHGTVTQYSLPTYKNYNYTWGVDANVLSAYSKLSLAQKGRILPYVDVGLGGSFNHSNRYSEEAIMGVTPRVSPNFGSRSDNHLTYNVGAGLDVALYPNVLLTIGYDYQSFGSISSGAGQGTWAAEKLVLGNVSSNMGLIGLTYLLDDYFYEY